MHTDTCTRTHTAHGGLGQTHVGKHIGACVCACVRACVASRQRPRHQQQHSSRVLEACPRRHHRHRALAAVAALTCRRITFERRELLWEDRHGLAVALHPCSPRATASDGCLVQAPGVWVQHECCHVRVRGACTRCRVYDAARHTALHQRAIPSTPPQADLLSQYAGKPASPPPRGLGRCMGQGAREFVSAWVRSPARSVSRTSTHSRPLLAAERRRGGPVRTPASTALCPAARMRTHDSKSASHAVPWRTALAHDTLALSRAAHSITSSPHIQRQSSSRRRRSRTRGSWHPRGLTRALGGI